MKKAVLIITMIFFFAVTYSQESKDVPVTETERIIDKYIDKTGEVIQNLASALKVPAEHVYSILVKQQVVVGISITIGFIMSIIFTIISWVIVKNKHDFGEEWYMQDTEGYWTVFILACLTLIAMTIALLIGGIPKLINPEYGAIQEILKAL